MLPISTRTTTKPRAVTGMGGFAADGPMGQTNNTDSFGTSGVDALGQTAAAAPTVAPAAPDPGAAQRELDRASNATATNNIGYTAQRGQENADTQAISNAADTHHAQIELPYLGEIPGIGNTLEGGFAAAQGGALAFADEAVSNPGLALATGGASAAMAGGDTIADNLATGVARDVTGNERTRIDVPGTPGQIWDPENPLYTDGNGNTIDIPGLSDAAGAVGDFFGGLGGGTNGGGGGAGGGNATLQSAADRATDSRTLGRGVLDGSVAPAGKGAEIQGSIFGQASNFTHGPRATDAAAGAVNAYQQGPRAQDSTMAGLDQFLGAPEGPSKAQLLLDQASQGAMSDVLSASRSGRARDAGSQARQAAVAQGEIAGMGVDNARNAGLLRAQEADDFRKQQLAGLTQKGTLASSVDQGTLEALGLGSTLATSRDANTLEGTRLGGDMANAIRDGNVTERGQSLNFGADMENTAAKMQGDVLNTIPQLEQIRHDDQYELTPDQKLKLAALGAGGDLLSSFF